MIIKMLFSLVVFMVANTSLFPATASETPTQPGSAVNEAEPIPGWRGVDEVREDVVEPGGFFDFSLGWVAAFFLVSGGLMVWLAWQSRGGGMLRGSGTEKIELVAKRMFGSKHGVVCVRLRDREFFLGIGGDNITLISEWRNRPEKSPEEEVLHGGGEKAVARADTPDGRS